MSNQNSLEDNLSIDDRDDPVQVFTMYESIGNMEFHNEIAWFEGRFAILARPSIGSSEAESKWFVYNQGERYVHG